MDYGKTWNSIYTTSGSEIPMIAVSRLRNTEGFASAWGSGGITKTVNSGSSWTSIASTGSTWGVDVARDDPNVVLYGTYGGSTSYLSNNAGASFTSTSLSGSNSGMLCYDRSTFIAHQAGAGVWKYNITYTVPTNNQSTLTVSAPSGGENWQYNTSHNITWASTYVSNVKIEYKTGASNPWQTIIASTPASTGSYAWLIPNAPTTQARVRVSDAATGTLTDSTHGQFSITVALIASQPTSINYGNVTVGSSQVQVLTLSNNGTAPLVISSVTASNSDFVAGRTSFTIAVGQSDTLSVSFSPTIVQTFSEQLSISCNAPGSPLAIPLSGNGTSASSLTVLIPNGGESWQANSVHNITWNATALDRVEISYKTSPTGAWQRIVQNIPASPSSYAWTIPNTPTTQARVKIVDRTSGAVLDSSDAFFTIQSPNSVSELGGIPTKYELNQNYPNPFNPSTVIIYGVPKEGFISLKIFNMIGQEVATLVNERMEAGRYSATFDTQKLTGTASSGLYFYRLSAGDFIEIRKMMLLK